MVAASTRLWLALCLVIPVGCAASQSSDSANASAADIPGQDAGARVCFPCEGYWSCGVPLGKIDLVPTANGCELKGMPDGVVVAPDGTLARRGDVIGRASGSGARVIGRDTAGTQLFVCAAGGGCD